MKKVLFASTAMVAFAGAASADVTLSGFAEMGIYDPGGFTINSAAAPGAQVVATNTDAQFLTDIDVTFTLSGETDNGLVFGASVDLDEPGAFANNTQGGETIFISGAFGTLTAGDTDGALDWALTEVGFGAGSINDDHTGHLGYNGNAGLDGLYDGQILRYDYSIGSFGVAVSAELDDAQPAALVAGRNTIAGRGDDVFGIGFKYDLDLGGTDLAFGLGYQTAAVFDMNAVGGPRSVDLDTVGLSITGSFAGGFTAGLSYVTYENHFPMGGTGPNTVPANTTNGIDDVFGQSAQSGRVITDTLDTDHIGVGVGYSAGAIAVGLNYGKYDHDSGFEAEGYGLSASYDLGGGALIQAGYGHSEYSGAGVNADNSTFSLGVRMNF